MSKYTVRLNLTRNIYNANLVQELKFMALGEFLEKLKKIMRRKIKRENNKQELAISFNIEFIHCLKTSSV